MFSSAFFGLVAWLYYLCILLLVALVFLIATQGSRRTRPRLRHAFLRLALSLLGWQLTLFLEARAVLPVAQLWLGRLNFTAIALAPCFALQFVQAVPVHKWAQGTRWNSWLCVETMLLAALTLLTPLIDAGERVTAGQAITTYGILFPVYLAHVLGTLGAALVVVIKERRHSPRPRVRSQLTLIAVGLLVTGGIACITNALLPYGFGDFRFCDIGPLSTICFVVAIAYATFIHRLFALRVMLRETLVYGILLAFVMGAYSSAVFVISQSLTEGAGKLTQFAVLLIAFSFDPLRRFLEEKTDRLLFDQRADENSNPGKDTGPGPQQSGSRPSQRAGKHRSNRSALVRLFPWRRP